MTPGRKRPIVTLTGVLPGTSASAQAASGRKSHRKISWDLVRSSCVVLVMIYHSTFLSVVLHPELEGRAIRFPWQVGASMLLVISAYFACVTVGKGTALRYWWGRVARLVPPFVATVLSLFVLLQFISPEGWQTPTSRDLWSNLFMLWHWKPHDYIFLDGSHWTVPLQLMGFSMAALLYGSRFGRRPAIVAIMWAAILLPVAQWSYRLSTPPEAYRMLVDGFGAHRWHLFVAGVAVWMWSTRRLSTPHFAALAASCMLAQGLHNHLYDANGVLVSNIGSTIGVSVGILVIAVTARGPDWNKVVPQWTHRHIQWFAGISYGVFLTHQTIGYVLSIHLHRLGVGAIWQVVVMLTAGVLCGWVMTRAVERPAFNFLMSTHDRLFPARRGP